MGISWISPLYLAGCLLLALPLLIHLLREHRPGEAGFPSLMFLQRIPLQQKRRLQIRHWLLLLLRCLLLLLIVFAFARPFLPANEAGGAVDTAGRDSVILLDRSYSMLTGDRWQQAQSAALEVIDRAAAGQRIALVLFDEESEVVSELTADTAIVAAQLRNTVPGLRSTRLRGALEQAGRLLAGSRAEDRRILLISDFHAPPIDAARIDASIRVETLPVETAASNNAGIRAYSIQPPSAGGLGLFSLRVELENYSSQARETELELILNGRVHERRPIRLEVDTIHAENFDDLTFGGDLARGQLRLAADGLAADNSVYFVFSKKQQVPVLLVEAEGGRGNQSLYIENALSLSRAPVYRVRRAGWKQLSPVELEDYAVVIVNDAGLPSAAYRSALRDFVAAGGGLLLALGESVQANWPSGESGFLPGRLQRRVDAAAGQARHIGAVAGDSPLEGIDLGQASIFSYRELMPNAGERVIAAYDDGAVALLQRRLGAGSAVVLTSTLDSHWNDLALRPVFVPLLHRLVNYLAAFESYPNSLRIGETLDVMRYARALGGADAVISAAVDSDLTIESPGGEESRLQRGRPLLRLGEQGFYQVHRATPAGTEIVLAANVDPAEAAYTRLDLAAFEEEIRQSAPAMPAPTVLRSRQAAEAEQRQQLWHDILALVLLLMLIEAFAANWTAVKRSGAT